jgi:hypothetical protein
VEGNSKQAAGPIYLGTETLRGEQAAAVRAALGDAVVRLAESGEDRAAVAAVRWYAAMHAAMAKLGEAERQRAHAWIYGTAPPGLPASPAQESSGAENVEPRARRKRPSAAAVARLRDHVEGAWAAKEREKPKGRIAAFERGESGAKPGPKDDLCRLAAMLVEVHEGDTERASTEWSEIAGERALRRDPRRLAQMAAQFWYSTENPEAWRAGIERLRALRDALREGRAVSSA